MKRMYNIRPSTASNRSQMGASKMGASKIGNSRMGKPSMQASMKKWAGTWPQKVSKRRLARTMRATHTQTIG